MANRMDFQVYHPDAIVTARAQERFVLQPWGVAGGTCGTAGATIVNPDGPSPKVIGKIDALRLDPGDVVSIRAPAGGGHGDPLERDPGLVTADIRAGLVTVATARDAYAVVLANGNVDLVATAEARTRARDERGAVEGFDFGPARRALEERWPQDVSGECARLVNTLPTAVRDYAKHRIFEAVQKVAASRRPVLSDVQAAWEAVTARLDRAIGGRANGGNGGTDGDGTT
jgi:N-methylhydantoinase B